MKRITINYWLFLVFAFVFFHYACKKENPPTITTLSVSEKTGITAKSGGNITDDGGSNVLLRGVVWGLASDPTIENHTGMTMDGEGKGLFVSLLTGLDLNAKYYVRAYATNSAGTSYGNQVQFTSDITMGIPCPGMPIITDINGNVYNTVLIGNQCWMKENLRVRNYKNGTMIPNITSNSGWTNLITGARCWSKNDSASYAATYGALYNWYAVENTNGLCPAGWHVPTDEEWTVLTDLLGGSGIAGELLKETSTIHWNSPNTEATNASGFTALPGDGRSYYSGEFGIIGNLGYWWCSTTAGTENAWSRKLEYNTGTATSNNYDKKHGFSVRCIRN